eukprot:TRINITY_DN6969_c0_g1_i2.p1 TRINITY_DN6969_c0_g1~~TRINITY_DN6969_c0_g1_i2.p1  ORF type:complete len:161 (-),score=14.49 TRINITY_DN6969_c0_g1_i2:32-514(-)
MFACLSDATEQCVPGAWILVTLAFILTFLLTFSASFDYSYRIAQRKLLHKRQELPLAFDEEDVQRQPANDERASFSGFFSVVMRFITRREEAATRVVSFHMRGSPSLVSAPPRHRQEAMPPQSAPGPVPLVLSADAARPELLGVVPGSNPGHSGGLEPRA